MFRRDIITIESSEVQNKQQQQKRVTREERSADSDPPKGFQLINYTIS